MDASRVRVLVTAFAAVPGSNSHTSALLGMAASVRAQLDMVTVKVEGLGHLERMGDARMFRVPCAGEPGEQRASFGRAVWRQLEAEAYDIVHARGPAEGMVVAGRRKEMGYRFVYEVASFADEAEGPGAEADWELMHHQCLDAADLVLVPTEAAARHVGTKGFGGKVAVVGPGVDVNAYDWWPKGRDEVTRLLYLGSFGADRDMGTLLGALRTVSRRRRLQVLVAGDPRPERRQRLRKMVEAFGLLDVVTVRTEPRARSLPSVIAACDVGLVLAAATPRFQELGDLPEPLLEYMACRRPIVAAGVPALAEIVRDEKEGLLYLPGDEDTLAESILTLAREPTLAERLVETAYDRVRWQFSAAARRRRIAEVYEMLAPGSQSYDVWSDAFDHEMTGALDVSSSSLFQLPGGGDVYSSVGSAGGARELDTHTTGQVRPDTGDFASHDLEGESDVTEMPPAPDDLAAEGTRPSAPPPAPAVRVPPRVPHVPPPVPAAASPSSPSSLPPGPAPIRDVDTVPGLEVRDPDTGPLEVP